MAHCGSAVSHAYACPAPIMVDICGLPAGLTSRHFPMAVRERECGIHNFSHEAVPASISPEDKIAELTKLIKILAWLSPLSRDAIKLFCSDPPAKSCMRSSSGPRGVRVRFHPRTVEPRITP